MKKIRYLLFIFGFMLCMIPNVNAEALQLTSPISAHWYGNGPNDVIYNYGTSATIDKFNFLGGNTYQHTFRTTFNMRGFSQLDQSKNYTMSFYIYLQNLEYGTIPNMTNVFAPVVRFASQTCYVQPLGFNTTSTGNYYYSGMYNVICDNITLSGDIYDVDVFTIKDFTANTSPNLYQGITPEWSIIENNQTLNKVVESNTQIKDSVNDLNSNITNDSIDSSDSTINDLKDKIPTNSVISDLLLLPVRFLQNFVNALSSSCSNFSLGSLYGTELFMPCINIQNYLGSGIWTTIDLIISGLFIYSLRKKFIQIYENLTNLQNGGNEID